MRYKPDAVFAGAVLPLSTAWERLTDQTSLYHFSPSTI
jgi:hypothetical protein